MEWNDLRLVLAISDAGTLSGAGRMMGQSHATVFRRLNNIENKLGVSLFHRARTGYEPTLAGEQIATSARNIEAQVNQVERSIIGQDLKPRGTVRLTTLDSLLFGLLTPLLASLQNKYPEISLEVSVSNQLFDLSKREADIAIRTTSKPSNGLFGRKVATIIFAVYGAKQILPEIHDQVSFKDWKWIGADEAMIYPELTNWMSKQGLDTCCTYKVDSVLGMYAATCAGLGLSVLPRYIGDMEPNLIRLSKDIPEIEMDLWMVTHNDLKKTARVRAVMESLGDSIGQQVKLQTSPYGFSPCSPATMVR